MFYRNHIEREFPMGTYLSIHSVTKIEAQAKRHLDETGGWVRYINIFTEDGAKTEIAVFGKDKDALVIAFPNGNTEPFSPAAEIKALVHGGGTKAPGQEI